MKSLILILILLLTLFAASGATKTMQQPTGLAGGWSEIKNVSDPHIQELGEYAVTEQNKRSKRQLSFEKVVKAESQVVAGINYRLRLTAKDGPLSRICQAVVWEKPWLNFKNLTSFVIITRI